METFLKDKRIHAQEWDCWVICSYWKELETLILSEVSQKEKDKYHMLSIISGIYYMAQRNLSAEKKLMDIENRLVLPRGGSGVDWGFGVNRCELLHSEWISNAILLYSTGNYI